MIASKADSIICWIFQVTEVYGSKDILDYDDLNKLVYLEQCIKECLRMHPPAQMTSRVCHTSDETVEGLFIPKGVYSFYVIFLINLQTTYDATIWPK